MKINVRWAIPYAEVLIEDGDTRIGLGMMDEDDRKELAQIFREAIEDLRLPVCLPVSERE